MKTERSGVSEKANASDSGRYAETKKLSSRIPAQGSFRWQIILVFVVGFFVLIAAFTAYQVRTESAYLYRDSTDETITLAESIAASSRSWVLANDVAGLQEVVHSLQGHTGLYYAMVISPSGRVLAHSDATKVGQFVSDDQSLALIKAPPRNQIMIDDASRIDIAVPILVENRLIGWARAAQGRKEIVGYLHNMMLSSALFVLMAVALSLLAALYIANRLGYRIGHLVQVAEAIQAGNYAARANISGADEIARLANSFNHMLDVLARDEAQLRAASLYTRSLIEASLDPLVTISAAGKITDVNQATEQVTGSSRAELIGTDFSSYFTEPEQARAGYLQAFQKGPVTDYPLALRHRDGHVTDVLYNASVYRNAAGEVLGVFAAARDVTERKMNEAVNASRLHLVRFSLTHTLDELLEETLNEAEKLTGSVIGFFHFVEDDQISLTLQNWSTRTKAVFCKAEGMGLHYRIDEAGVWVDCVRQGKAVIHNDYASLPNRKGMPEGHATVIRELVVPVFRGTKISAILGVGNKPANYNEEDVSTVSMLADLAFEIAERKKAEDKIIELNLDLERRVTERTAQLADANKELEAFSYSVSHDLRTPLRAIDGFSLMLLEDYADQLDDEGKRLLNVVRNNTSRMAHLIDDILHFSRVGRIEISFVETDMEQMVRDVLDELAPIIAGRKIQINLSVLPKALCDRAMMHQVIENLLSNAIKFTGKKDDARIDIGGRIEGNQAIYYVKDNGAGFDMQYANKLFGVFQRLHGIDEFEGTGIGLAIVKRIINRHGGTVWAEGEVGKGATIYFSIPIPS